MLDHNSSQSNSRHQHFNQPILYSPRSAMMSSFFPEEPAEDDRNDRFQQQPETNVNASGQIKLMNCDGNEDIERRYFTSCSTSDTIIEFSICERLQSQIISVERENALAQLPISIGNATSNQSKDWRLATRVFHPKISDSFAICDELKLIEGDRADAIRANSPGPMGSASCSLPSFVYSEPPHCCHDDLNDDEVRRLLQHDFTTKGTDLATSFSDRSFKNEGMDCYDGSILDLLEDSTVQLFVHSEIPSTAHTLVIPRPYLNFDKMQKNTLRRQRSRIRRVNKGGVRKTRLPRFKTIRQSSVQSTFA